MIRGHEDTGLESSKEEPTVCTKRHACRSETFATVQVEVLSHRIHDIRRRETQPQPEAAPAIPPRRAFNMKPVAHLAGAEGEGLERRSKAFELASLTVNVRPSSARLNW